MGCFNIIQCVQSVGLGFIQLVNPLPHYLRLVFAPHTRVRQVPSQQRSGDGGLTLGAECISVLSILSHWRAYLALFVLGTMSAFFLLLTFQGFSVSQCFINDHSF